jgi:hypothetical protein
MAVAEVGNGWERSTDDVKQAEEAEGAGNICVGGMSVKIDSVSPARWSVGLLVHC